MKAKYKQNHLITNIFKHHDFLDFTRNPCSSHIHVQTHKPLVNITYLQKKKTLGSIKAWEKWKSYLNFDSILWKIDEENFFIFYNVRFNEGGEEKKESCSLKEMSSHDYIA